jgi:hypothetical protein
VLTFIVRALFYRNLQAMQVLVGMERHLQLLANPFSEPVEVELLYGARFLDRVLCSRRFWLDASICEWSACMLLGCSLSFLPLHHRYDCATPKGNYNGGTDSKGGKGGGGDAGNPPKPGIANTGSGGGGVTHGDSNIVSGAGGSGVVIIRYLFK